MTSNATRIDSALAKLPAEAVIKDDKGKFNQIITNFMYDMFYICVCV